MKLKAGLETGSDCRPAECCWLRPRAARFRPCRTPDSASHCSATGRATGPRSAGGLVGIAKIRKAPCPWTFAIHGRGLPSERLTAKPRLFRLARERNLARRATGQHRRGATGRPVSKFRPERFGRPAKQAKVHGCGETPTSIFPCWVISHWRARRLAGKIPGQTSAGQRARQEGNRR